MYHCNDFQNTPFSTHQDCYSVILNHYELPYDLLSEIPENQRTIPCDMIIEDNHIILKSRIISLLSQSGQAPQNEETLYGIIFRNNNPYIKEVLKFELTNHHTINGLNDNWQLKAKLPRSITHQ